MLEGCLSFPNDTIKTIRYKSVTVKADNHTGKLHFGVWKEHNEEGYNTGDKLTYAMETACVQHEIDHLNGITMFDRLFELTPIKRSIPKIGRNEKVTIKKADEVKVLKWKKAEKMLSEGWTLSETQLKNV